MMWGSRERVIRDRGSGYQATVIDDFLSEGGRQNLEKPAAEEGRRIKTTYDGKDRIGQLAAPEVPSREEAKEATSTRGRGNGRGRWKLVE